MGLTLYQPAPVPPNENERERAVEASGAARVREDGILQDLVERARSQFGTAMAAISIVQSDWQFLIAATGLPGGAYSRRTSFCGHAIAEEGEVFCVPDALEDPRFAGNPAIVEQHLVRFYAAAKVKDDQDMPLGTLCVFDPKPRTCSSDQEDVLLVQLAHEVSERLQVLAGRST